MYNQELFEKADRYKIAIQSHRPLKPEEIKELEDYFRIGLTYSSNALEGNTLTISETKVLLEDGLTAGGKPMRDSLEAVGHAEAYNFMIKIAKTPTLLITEDIIKELHRLFYSGIDSDEAGKYRSIQVFITGTTYLPPAPNDIPNLMSEFIARVNSVAKNIHPIELATLAHKWLVDIHPFKDGNGRTARLLMNLILINKGYGVVCISPVLRQEYIDALRVSQREDNPSNDLFIRLIAECVIETGRDYCRMLRIKL